MSALMTAAAHIGAGIFALIILVAVADAYNGPAMQAGGPGGLGGLGGQIVDITQYQAGCTFVCTVAPTSLKCFRCKNRIPMRFGKRSVAEDAAAGEDEAPEESDFVLLRSYYDRLRRDLHPQQTAVRQEVNKDSTAWWKRGKNQPGFNLWNDAVQRHKLKWSSPFTQFPEKKTHPMMSARSVWTSWTKETHEMLDFTPM